MSRAMNFGNFRSLRKLPERGAFASILIASVASLSSAACSADPAPAPTNPASTAQSAASAPPIASASAATTPPAPSTIAITIIGTSDVHGHLEQLPAFGGFVAAVRSKVGADHVLLLDAGDMFQGTLESNLNEGAAVIRAYNVLKYDAAAIGNHEFDYGPEGPNATPHNPTENPRGAIAARAAQAHFPILVANVQDTSTSKQWTAPNIFPSTIVEKHGVRIGVIGVTSSDTPKTTISVNFAGLAMLPTEDAVAREAKSLRDRGADIVVLTAHAGGKCKNTTDTSVDGECDPHQEIMALLDTLPAGTVDAIVGGHTHAGVASIIHGVPVVQSFANGHAFGRIDLDVDPASKKVVKAKVYATQEIKVPSTYEGIAIESDAAVAQSFAEDVEHARAIKERKVGVTLTSRIKRSHDHESAEGNLFADLMLASHPKADIAITNGGGLRADLPAGELTYGALFESMPFDNRFARVPMTGAELRGVLVKNAKDDHGIMSFAGMEVEVTCNAGVLDAKMFRRTSGRRGAEIRDTDKLTITTSDFLALGGDKSGLGNDRVVIEDALVRDAFEKGLTHHAPIGEKDVYDPLHPRWKLPSERPVKCEK